MAPITDSENLLVNNADDLESALKLMALLSNPTRLKMALLLSERELRVNDLEKILKVDQSLVSHYIKAFKDMNLTTMRREGRSKYYFINDKRLKDFFSVLNIPAR